MREIKFRAWESELKEWHYFTIPNAIFNSPPGMSYGLNYRHWCECTGLKDKNDKEIYEGDILKFSEYYSGDHFYKESIEVIEWDQTGYTEKLWIGYADEPDWCEVIGNIYENPELLNKKEVV